MLDDTIVGRMLRTARGGAIPDDGIAAAIVGLAALGEDHPEIAEADLNPILVGRERTVAVDALVVRADAPPADIAGRLADRRAGPRASGQRGDERMSESHPPISSTLRVRMGQEDAHYGGNPVAGARTLALFGDTSRTVSFEARKVIASRYDLGPSAADVLAEPIVTCRAIFVLTPPSF